MCCINLKQRTAFVHFSKPEEAKACLEAAENGLQIDGRDVVGSLAMQRENATSIQKRKNLKVPEDKRNLRLVRFSLIREGTSAANGMSSEDARKRQRLAESSRRKLENLHMFISPTRLMVHNLPSSMTDGKLREICLEAAGKFAHITECRIWKDTSKLDSKGNARSKGYAFVNFSEHSDALQCLQKLNNNPHIFTNERRPIVEFAIENLLAIRAKVRRSAHSKGETLTGRELSDKVKIQVKHSIEEVSKSGMKVMPKFLGRKLRHKNMSKTQLKKKRKGSQSSSTNSTKKFKKEDGTARNVGAKKNKKLMTKYLAFSS
uniref:RNA recognition motif domain containing protein n=1 Tax=Haemonchus contortus TaxID=6289 RepID=W6NG57_HAECO